MDNHNDIFDDDSAAPLNEGGSDAFLPPDGYFETFSSKLMARIEAEEELKEFPVLSALSKQSPFTIPDGYFNNAAECRAELAAYPQLGKIDKPAYLPVEDAYFDAMQQQVLYKAELADELKPYPVLHAIDKREPAWTVPVGYFEDLAGRVKERVHTGAIVPAGLLARIAAFVFRPKMALSFGLALILGIGFVAYNRPDPAAQPVPDSCKTLACLEKSDVLNDNTMHSLDDESLIDIVDVNTLGSQISADAPKPDAAQEEQYIIDNTNTNQLIDDL